jgi:hypothetical protein
LRWEVVELEDRQEAGLREEGTARARQDTPEDVVVTQVLYHIQGQAVVAEEPP